MTDLAAPVRSATGTLALPPHATVTLSVAAVLGPQLLTTESSLSPGEEQPGSIFRMASICRTGTFIPAARRDLARTRLAVHRRDERLRTAGQACAAVGARPIRSGGSAAAGQERSPAGRRDTPNKRVNLTRSTVSVVTSDRSPRRLRAVR